MRILYSITRGDAMKSINISKTIMKKRKEKRVTQEELAEYIGVSKASVSKWENDQSYPDITFLPQLATYFNISIDELMGYSPQMTKAEIKKLYHSLSLKFTNRPFNEVMNECREIIREYHACFPLLLQMTVLIINHYMLADKKHVQEEILKENIELCVYIKYESQYLWISKQANSIEAMCYMMLNEPTEVLELLDENIKPFIYDEGLLAKAYESRGEIEKSKRVLQISIYQSLLNILTSSISYLSLNVNEVDKYEEILRRILSIMEVFKIEKLHPNTALQVYYLAAQSYAIQGKKHESLKMLGKYAEVCISGIFPITLNGDEFFNYIEQWIDEFDLGREAPREDKVIKDSMIQCITGNPIFKDFADEPIYKNLINILESKFGGK